MAAARPRPAGRPRRTHQHDRRARLGCGRTAAVSGWLASGAMDITTTPAWSALQSTPPPPHLRALFADDPKRSVRYRVQAGDLQIDYSKNLIDDDVMRRLLAVAATAGVEARRAAMFSGQPINVTERRSVLHTALRAPRDAVVEVDGHNVV